MADFKANAVWQFVGNDEMGETLFKPVKKLPTKSPEGKLVGLDLKLANGQKNYGYIGNVSTDNPRKNQFFPTLAFFKNEKVFHLARYFEEEFKTNGADGLAVFLNLPKEDIFPIEYDPTPYSPGVCWEKGAFEFLTPDSRGLSRMFSDHIDEACSFADAAQYFNRLLGESEALKGFYPAEPSEKLSLQELTRLSIRILPKYPFGPSDSKRDEKPSHPVNPVNSRKIL